MSQSGPEEIAAYERGLNALLALIHGDHPDSPNREDRRRRAEARLERTRILLDELGNPHRRYPVVHVTGTSGKGSTSAAIAAILTAAGYRVGLRTSPFLQVATEKLQIGSSLIAAAAFERLTATVLGEANRHSSSVQDGPRLSYAEAWSGLAFSWFAERDVDLAVVEVGAGGRFDATNVVNPTVSVITSVGFDHVVSLGPSLADIAWHKAGIIKPGAIAVVGAIPNEALPVIQDAACTAGAPVMSAQETSLDPAWSVGSYGRFQQDNARTAVTAIAALRRQGFAVSDGAIAAGLESARLPGRLEAMPAGDGPRVWIDGAHNADKISAVAREAGALGEDGSLPVVVFGLLGAKDATAIVARLIPAAAAIVTTQPAVLGKTAVPAEVLVEKVRAAGFRGIVQSDPDPLSALAIAERLAAERGSEVLVTGSLYLAGEIRRRWYPDTEIVLQRTPWPTQGARRVASGVVRARGRLPGHEPHRERDHPAHHQDQPVVEQLAVGGEG